MAVKEEVKGGQVRDHSGKGMSPYCQSNDHAMKFSYDVSQHA
jgi:hypothetical protein